MIGQNSRFLFFPELIPLSLQNMIEYLLLMFYKFLVISTLSFEFLELLDVSTVEFYISVVLSSSL